VVDAVLDAMVEVGVDVLAEVELALVEVLAGVLDIAFNISHIKANVSSSRRSKRFQFSCISFSLPLAHACPVFRRLSRIVSQSCQPDYHNPSSQL